MDKVFFSQKRTKHSGVVACLFNSIMGWGEGWERDWGGIRQRSENEDRWILEAGLVRDSKCKIEINRRKHFKFHDSGHECMDVHAHEHTHTQTHMRGLNVRW